MVSTGLNCYFAVAENQRWYYVLERMDAPKIAWDWREFAQAYGFFNTFDEALAHLHSRHANPGGYSVHETYSSPDDTERELLAGIRR